jgi:hypothetical protein
VSLKDNSVDCKDVARELRLIVLLCSREPVDVIKREILALRDRLYVPIQTGPGAQTETRYIKGKRIAVKTARRKDFTISGK